MLYNKLCEFGLSGNISFALSMLLCVIVPYLLGSLNFGIILSKRMYHADVRQSGSGNAGSTNMLRTYGKRAGAMTFLLDCLKTVISIFLGPLFYLNAGSMYLAMFLAGVACMIGHSYPVFFKFKGGKGVACFAMLVTVTGICMNLWYMVLILFLLFVLIVVFTKYVSLASVMCALTYPVLLNRLNGDDRSMEIFAVLAGLIVVFQHRSNIVRLIQGQENKIGEKKKKAANKSDR